VSSSGRELLTFNPALTLFSFFSFFYILPEPAVEGFNENVVSRLSGPIAYSMSVLFAVGLRMIWIGQYWSSV